MFLNDNNELFKAMDDFEQLNIDSQFQWNFILLEQITSCSMQEILTKLLKYALNNKDAIAHAINITDMPHSHFERINTVVNQLNEVENIADFNSLLGDLKIDLD